jgi:hypothetical protein
MSTNTIPPIERARRVSLKTGKPHFYVKRDSGWLWSDAGVPTDRWNVEAERCSMWCLTMDRRATTQRAWSEYLARRKAYGFSPLPYDTWLSWHQSGKVW